MAAIRFRYSLFGLFGIVAFCAVSAATLAKPSFLAASLVWSVAMAVLGVALVGSATSRGRRQSFWIGFAILGWGYMILTLAPWFDDHTGELLASRQLFDYVGPALGHEPATLELMPGIWRIIFSGRDDIPAYVYLIYVVTGHSLLSLVVGFFGGLLGGYFHRSSQSVRKDVASQP